MSSHKHRRTAPEEKIRAVLRSFRGESRDDLAAELHVAPERIASWEATFLEGGKAALEAASKRGGSHAIKKALSQIAPWTSLILVLFIVVYFLTKFMGRGAGEAAP